MEAVWLQSPSEIPLTAHLSGAATIDRSKPTVQFPAPSGPTEGRAMLPWVPPTPKVMANRMRRASSQADLVRRVEAIGRCLTPRLGTPTGADRLNALASRVRAKSSLPTLRAGACRVSPEATDLGLRVRLTQAASVGDQLSVPAELGA